MVTHVNLTDAVDADLHEQKGVSTAEGGDVPFSDGAGGLTFRPFLDIIGDTTISGSTASVEFTGLEDYEYLKIECFDMESTSTGEYIMQLGDSSYFGSVYANALPDDTWRSSGYDNEFRIGYFGTSLTPFASNYSSTEIYGNQSGNFNIVYSIWNNSDSTTASATSNSGWGMTFVKDTSVIEKLKVDRPSGNFDGGRIICSGYKKVGV